MATSGDSVTADTNGDDDESRENDDPTDDNNTKGDNDTDSQAELAPSPIGTDNDAAAPAGNDDDTATNDVTIGGAAGGGAPAVTAQIAVSPTRRSRRRLAGRWVMVPVLVVIGLAAWWGISEALEITGQVVQDTTLTPEAYLDQVVLIDVEGVEQSHTLAELGWTTETSDTVTGRLFARLRVHTPVEPPGGVAASPIVTSYRSELEREPTPPVIDVNWRVVAGKPGVATDVTVDQSSPPKRIVVSTEAIRPEPSSRLRSFVRQRNLHSDGWEIQFLDQDGEPHTSLTPEEVAAHIRFDRQSATVELVDEAELRDLVAERLRLLAHGGERGQYEFEASDDGVTPVMRRSQFVVVDTLAKPQPGQVPDMDQAWDDLMAALRSFDAEVTVALVDADDLYDGVEPADLTVKLAESRTPNTGGERMTNIRNLLEVIRGVVVEPGGVFGLNQTVGERSQEKGFVVAGAIANGEHVDAVGGGISQTATMVHQAAYMAGLIFPEREGGGIGGGHGLFGHSEYFGRYDNFHAEGWGLDGQLATDRLGRAVEQTVNWPNREAGFINTTPYPILVWTFDTGDTVGVSLWSLERTRYGVYEGTVTSRRGSCIDWAHSRTVYDMDDNVMFEDSYRGFYRTAGPTCAVPSPEPPDDE